MYFSHLFFDICVGCLVSKLVFVLSLLIFVYFFVFLLLYFFFLLLPFLVNKICVYIYIELSYDDVLNIKWQCIRDDLM